jgi:DNA-binding IclR family transcriptional regulator
LNGAPVKILNKSIAILDLFLASEGELSIEDIAKRSSLNKSTARRIVLSLVECGFLKKQKRGKCSLGIKFLDYIQAVKRHNPILDIAEHYLIELRQATDETVSLALWDGRDAVIYRTIYPNHPLRVTANEGSLVGLHFTSLGKAILAELPEEELNQHLSNKLTRYTSNTITDINSLKKNLMVVRQESVAIDDEEAFQGVRGIAATLKNNDGVLIGAVNIIGPSVRLTREKFREYVPLVKECAFKISKELGYNTRV